MDRQDNQESVVRKAMVAVPRVDFVPNEWKWAAEEDRPLPIGSGQTVSQPYTVAKMLEQLADGGRIVIPVRGEMIVIEKHGKYVFVPLI